MYKYSYLSHSSLTHALLKHLQLVRLRYLLDLLQVTHLQINERF